MSYNGLKRFMGILRDLLTTTAVFLALASFSSSAGAADLVMLKSGTGISGVVESSGGADIRVRVAGRIQVIPVEKVDSIQFDSAAAGAAAAMKAGPHRTFVLPAGAPLVVRIVDRIEPKKAGLLHLYQASLAEPLTSGGLTAAPAGCVALLQVTGVKEKRRSATFTMQVVELDVEGKRIPISTADLSIVQPEPGAQVTFQLSREAQIP